MKNLKRNLAVALVIAIGLVLLYGLLPYLSGVFGAIILYVLFLPLYKFFLRLAVPRKGSALLTILISILVLIIPLILVILLSVNELKTFELQKSMLMNEISRVDALLPSVDMAARLSEFFPSILESTQSFLTNIFGRLAQFIANIAIMYFLLFFMFIEKNRLDARLLSIIPFSRKNSRRLIEEFRNVTNSTIITSGLIALLQGGLLTVGFLIFDIQGAFLWGLIGFILSFIPLLGVALIWVPTSIFFLLQQNYWVGIGMLLWGLFTSYIDNPIRPFIQEKVGRIHPVTILIGVFIGLPLLGLVGIIIGPLIVSYFALVYKMFLEEYVESGSSRSP